MFLHLDHFSNMEKNGTQWNLSHDPLILWPLFLVGVRGSGVESKSHTGKPFTQGFSHLPFRIPAFIKMFPLFFFSQMKRHESLYPNLHLSDTGRPRLFIAFDIGRTHS